MSFNPFWWSADDKFFNNSLADTLGYHYPIRFYCHPQNIQQIQQEKSFRNLKFPMDWEGIFDYIKFPAYMKPYAVVDGKMCIV
jgi:hypothetical protein